MVIPSGAETMNPVFIGWWEPVWILIGLIGYFSVCALIGIFVVNKVRRENTEKIRERWEDKKKEIDKQRSSQNAGMY